MAGRHSPSDAAPAEVWPIPTSTSLVVSSTRLLRTSTIRRRSRQSLGYFRLSPLPSPWSRQTFHRRSLASLELGQRPRPLIQSAGHSAVSVQPDRCSPSQVAHSVVHRPRPTLIRLV